MPPLGQYYWSLIYFTKFRNYYALCHVDWHHRWMTERSDSVGADVNGILEMILRCSERPWLGLQSEPWYKLIYKCALVIEDG